MTPDLSNAILATDEQCNREGCNECQSDGFECCCCCPSNQSGTHYGIVMEAIPQTPDTTSDPVQFAFGKIRVFVKEYPVQGDPPQAIYDDCACGELAETEHILKGAHVEVVGPFYYKVDNPDYHPDEAEGPENPPLIDRGYYVAVNTPGDYTASLESDLVYGGTSSIRVMIGSEEKVFTVYCKKLSASQSLKAGMGVTVSRTVSNNGRILEVMLGPCPVEN